MVDQSGRSSLWVAPTSRRSSPRPIPSAAVEDSPFFLPDGDLIFRAFEGGSNFLYRMKADGTGRRKIIPERILGIETVSPDGRWVIAGSQNPDEERPVMIKAFPVNGGASELLCTAYCPFTWDSTGKFIYLSLPELQESSYIIPVIPDVGLPRVPSTGIAAIDDFANAKTISIPWQVGSALSSSVYAYSRENTRRNLYRIQLR
jgi:hypothetical protein